MTRIARLFVFVLMSGAIMAGTGIAAAQTSSSSTTATASPVVNPVAEVRNARSWEYGPFAAYGNGVGNRSDYHFAMAGFQVGKPVSGVIHAGIFSGQFEMAGNIMPFWQAYTPGAHTEPVFNGQPCTYNGQPCKIGGGTYRGVSATPIIWRWNFLTRSRRFQPWAQAAGGLIYTTHKFPGVQEVPHGTPGGSSVFNFSPQGGGGVHYFISPKRSIDLGINAVHISSASLGDRNPGVNCSMQIQLGYTLWK